MFATFYSVRQVYLTSLECQAPFSLFCSIVEAVRNRDCNSEGVGRIIDEAKRLREGEQLPNHERHRMFCSVSVACNRDFNLERRALHDGDSAPHRHIHQHAARLVEVEEWIREENEKLQVKCAK